MSALEKRLRQSITLATIRSRLRTLAQDMEDAAVSPFPRAPRHLLAYAERVRLIDADVAAFGTEAREIADGRRKA